MQQCTRCVMDTSDADIQFDADGVCNHCRRFDAVTRQNWFPNEEGKRRWAAIAEDIRRAGKGKDYDCILGLSGGVDSSYLALKVGEWGLRPLVFHVDAGWNSEIAVGNIERLVAHGGYHLFTHVVDWEEMRDLQVAFLRAGIPNQDVPQDHAFFATMYHFATRNRIKYVLSGGNIATEGIFPDSWHGSAMDAINLRAIHRRFGRRPLKAYKTIGFLDQYIWYPMIRGMRTVRPLNYMPYDKREAIDELARTVGWRPYGRKHGESHFTKLFQNYYLPTRFGFDKRRPHLSSLIVSGQMSREEAVRQLEEPLYEARELEADIVYFCKKLQLSREEFTAMMTQPLAHHTDFATWDARYRRLKRVQSLVERVTGKRVGVYS